MDTSGQVVSYIQDRFTPCVQAEIKANDSLVKRCRGSKDSSCHKYFFTYMCSWYAHHERGMRRQDTLRLGECFLESVEPGSHTAWIFGGKDQCLSFGYCEKRFFCLWFTTFCMLFDSWNFSFQISAKIIRFASRNGFPLQNMSYQSPFVAGVV